MRRYPKPTVLKEVGFAVPFADTRTLIPPPKVALPFYSSPEWRGLMKVIIKERGRRCERCGRTGCRIFGDHKREIKDGGARLDPRNVELLCGSCHTTKTNAAKRARASEGPNDYRQRTGVCADTRTTQTSMFDGVVQVGLGHDGQGSADFEAMLEEALSGRAKKRR